MGKIKKAKPEKGLQLNQLQLAALAVAFNRDVITIKRWAKQNHGMLRLPEAQQVIRQFENISNTIQPIH